MKENINLPMLPLNEWEDTKMTLHLYLQIVGKIRLKMTPRKNHWWYITEYVSTRGITTGPIHYDNGLQSLTITFDFIQHKLEILTSKGEIKDFDLVDGLSAAMFFEKITTALDSLGAHVSIIDHPFDLSISKPFSQITEYHHYNRHYVERFRQIMLWVDGVFKEFSGRFYGKTCPVHLYWHHMDLTVTRFSGKKGPALDPKARISDKDAYTHEVISFGFWVGDENVREPAFYSYTYPSPENLEKSLIKPKIAQWTDSNGTPMAIMRYHDLLKEENPRKSLLEFLESNYQAGATLSKWDIAELTVPALEDL